MEKEAFLRLPEAKRELLLKKGKEAYVRYPFEDITIRFLTGELGIDLTTFYRYFESRDDLLIYAYRDLIGRTRYEDYALVYRFVNVYDDALDNDFFAACMRIGNAHREIRDRLLQVEQDILYPIISRKLRAEKYAGRVSRLAGGSLSAEGQVFLMRRGFSPERPFCAREAFSRSSAAVKAASCSSLTPSRSRKKPPNIASPTVEVCWR